MNKHSTEERAVEESSPHKRSESSMRIQPLYTPEDLHSREFEEQEDLAHPGEFPFTRGITGEMYTREPWIMGQYSGYSSPQETNQRIKELLKQGQRGFSVALDLPTQIGLDSDDPAAIHEVGRVGVPIDSLRDVEDLFQGIPLDQVAQIRTTANSIGPIMLSFFIAAAEKHGYTPDRFRVMFQNDVLKEYIARGTYIFPPIAGLRFSVDVIEYCAKHLPHWEPIEFCGYHIRDSGATAVQESAIAIANGLAYIEATLERGLSFEQFGHSLVMFLSAAPGLFQEVAKFRATRRVWARQIKERFGPDDDICALKIFSYTLGSPLTAEEPLNNIIRVTLESLAAVLGGVQTLASSSYDEALGLPSDEAAHIALRTQQILAYEGDITKSVDPLGGSFLLESLTIDFEKRILDYLGDIEEQGGALNAFETGWLALEIEQAAYRHHREIEDGTQPIIGVNCFVDETERQGKRKVTAKKLDPNIGSKQTARLQEIREQRNARVVQKCLETVREAALNDENTIPSILEAVKAYATIGEITSVLQSVWGTHHP